MNFQNGRTVEIKQGSKRESNMGAAFRIYPLHLLQAFTSLKIIMYTSHYFSNDSQEPKTWVRHKSITTLFKKHILIVPLICRGLLMSNQDILSATVNPASKLKHHQVRFTIWTKLSNRNVKNLCIDKSTQRQFTQGLRIWRKR